MRLLVLLLSLGFVASNAQNALFPIVENGLKGFIDAEGKVIIAPKFKAIKSFSEGLAAARLPRGLYGFIDEKGDWKIAPQYDYALSFSEGLAVVFKDGQAFCIDRKGLSPFVIDSVTEMTSFRNGISRIRIGALKTEDVYRTKNPMINTFLIDKKGHKLEPNMPLPNLIEPIKKDSTLKLMYKKSGQSYYANLQNKVVWQSKPSQQIDTFDMDYMNDMGFYPASRANLEYQRLGGRGGSDYKSDAIISSINAKNNAFSLEIRADDTVHIGQQGGFTESSYLGYQLFIINNTVDTFLFEAYDGRIDMTVQALNKSGEWQDINYYRSSGCGNSLHVLALNPRHYWQLKMPLFKGGFDTKLRLKLMKKTDTIRNYWVMPESGVMEERKPTIPLYSNEIKVSINPAQLWRPYIPVIFSIMEFYHDDY